MRHSKTLSILPILRIATTLVASWFFMATIQAQDVHIINQNGIQYSQALDTVLRQPLFRFDFSGLLAVPIGSFGDVANPMPGFFMSWGAQFKSNDAVGWGISTGLVGSGSRKDPFMGKEVTTSAMILTIQPMIRCSLGTSKKLKGFIDTSVGLYVYGINTESDEVVYQPSLLEQLLFGAEPEIETTIHASAGGSALSYTFGGGLLIRRFIKIGVSYMHCNHVEVANRDKVYFDGDKVVYEVKKMPVNMITFTIGITTLGNSKKSMADVYEIMRRQSFQ